MELYRNKNWLYEQYITLNKNLHEIAKELNCDFTTISIWLKKFNIKKDKSLIVESQKEKFKQTILIKQKDLPYTNKEWLEEQYIILNKSVREIEKEFGYKSIIQDWIKRFDLHKDKKKVYSHKNNKLKEIWNNKTQEEINNHVKKNKESKLKNHEDENYQNIEKIQRTKLNKYGDKNYNNIEKARVTCINRYGVACIFNIKDVREKSSSEESNNKKSESMKKYWSRLTKEDKNNIVKKVQNTCKEKYGLICPLQIKWINEKSHSQKYIKIANETRKYNQKIGKFRYKNINMKSSWEVRYAEYLDKNNIQWEYEPILFTLKNSRGYFPDFYLPQTNEFIEIKGYTTKIAELKLKLFKEQYSHIKLTILKEEDLKKLNIL